MRGLNWWEKGEPPRLTEEGDKVGCGQPEEAKKGEGLPVRG